MIEPVKITEIFKSSTSWDGAPLPGVNAHKTEFKILRFKMPPGAKTTIHMHPLNGAGYMIAGELTMYATEDPHGNFTDPKKVKEVVLSPGDAWAETVNTWHYGINKGSIDVEFVLMFVGQAGTPPTLSMGTHPK
jgi:quercetin dioxygenase-like cupin family protein